VDGTIRGVESIVRQVRARLGPRAPGVTTLRHYERSWLRSDVLAGVTVAAYLVPQVMAYAGVAGLPVAAGLWSAVVSLTVYAVLGSSRQLSVGPESSTALLSAVIVGPLAGGDQAKYAELSVALAILVGLYAVLAWVARLGFVGDLLSRPVMVGYLAGLALVMTAGQLERVTGVEIEGETFVAQVRSFLEGADGIHWLTVAVATCTLGFLLVVQRLSPRAPGPLFALVIATTAVVLFGLEDHGIRVVGTLHDVSPHLPRGITAEDVRQLLLPAVGLLVVGYADNVVTARAFALRKGHDIDPNQELLALGTANIGSGLAGGFAVSSSASRTSLGDAVGSKTQLYSLVCVASVLVVIGTARPVLAHFPVASLGALVLFAASRLVDVAGLRRLARFRRSELALALVAAAGVLAFGILYGVLVAVGVSVADMLSRVARPHDAVLGRIPGLAGMHDIDDYPEADLVPGLLVYRYDSPLFFANAENFRRRALAAADATPDLAWFVLNAEATTEVDITGLDALEQVRSSLVDRGVVVGLARVKQDLLRELTAYGLTTSIGRDHMYPTLPTALEAYESWRGVQGSAKD
jgi:SulP family sulfate permease